MKRWSQTAGIAVGTALALFLAASVQADPTPQEVSAARSLFTKAAAELDAKQYTAACPKLEEVVRVVPRAIGAKLALAECYEGLGKTASAWLMWGEAALDAAAEHQTAREKQARARVTALEAKLPKLAIVIAPDVAAIPQLTVQRDGSEVGRPQWNMALPVDPGSHTIRLGAPGRRDAERTIEVADGASEQVRFERLDALAAPPSPTAHDASAPPDGSAPPSAPPLRTVGFAVGAVGLAGLVAGSVFGVVAIASKASETGCDGNLCDATGTDDRNRTRTFGNVSTFAFVAGGVLAAGGVALLVLAPKSSSKAALGVAPNRATVGARF